VKPCPDRGSQQRRKASSGNGSASDDSGNPKKESSKFEARTEELVKALKKQGVDLPTAKKVLQAWREVGIESTDDLQKALQQRSSSAMGIVFVQAMLDATAAYISFSAAQFFDTLGGWSSLLSIVSYGICFLYSSNAFFDLVTLATILTSPRDTVSSDAAALMTAVKRMAGEDRTQLDVLGKAQRAISMLKIVRSLNEVSMLMKQTPEMDSSLEKLAAYLTLANAESNGFDPARYAMSEGEALRVAAKFARFDTNDDGCIELSELSEGLFREMGLEFTEEESKAALNVLDIKRNGVVDFEEFVEWYTKQIPEPPASPSEEPAAAM